MIFWFVTIFQIILLITGVVIVVRGFYVIHSFRHFYHGVPYVPTSHGAFRRIITHSGLKNQPLDKKIKIIDLGSGTGKVVFPIAKKTQNNAHIYGVEISKTLYFISKIRRFFSFHKKKITFILGSYDDISLHDFDYVFFFLSPPSIKELYPKLKNELRVGTVIISFLFPLPEDTDYEKKMHSWTKKDRIYIQKKIR